MGYWREMSSKRWQLELSQNVNHYLSNGNKMYSNISKYFFFSKALTSRLFGDKSSVEISSSTKFQQLNFKIQKEKSVQGCSQIWNWKKRNCCKIKLGCRLLCIDKNKRNSLFKFLIYFFIKCITWKCTAHGKCKCLNYFLVF